MTRNLPKSWQLVGPGFVLPLFVAALAGCGPSRPPTAPVEGVVTLGGQPLEGAAVTFTPVEGGRPATGATDAQGRFRLSTFDPGDGAVLGEHVATVYKEEAASVIVEEGDLDGGPAGPAPAPRLLVPARYASRDTSELRFTVARRMAPVEIALSPD